MSSRVRFAPGTLVLLGAVLGGGACSDTSGPTLGEAELRVLHATPALGAVSVEVGGITVIASLSYGSASGLVRVPEGAQHLVVRAGGQTLGELDLTLTTDHVNSVVVAEGTPRLLSQVTPDTGQAASNRANIRMVNVVGPTAQPPTLLHVLVDHPDPQNPDSIMRFGLDTQVASYGTLLYFDPGPFVFTYVPQGASNVLATVSFTVAAGEKKAVVLERAADGSYRVQVVVEQ